MNWRKWLYIQKCIKETIHSVTIQVQYTYLVLNQEIADEECWIKLHLLYRDRFVISNCYDIWKINRSVLVRWRQHDSIRSDAQLQLYTCVSSENSYCIHFRFDSSHRRYGKVSVLIRCWFSLCVATQACEL
jgi:hypothetical protein